MENNKDVDAIAIEAMMNMANKEAMLMRGNF
jgi:hypothetical protein